MLSPPLSIGSFHAKVIVVLDVIPTLIYVGPDGVAI